MRHHKHLASEQRHQISALKKAGVAQTEIAKILGVHKSTISNELKRNRGLRGYRPQQAQRLAENRQKGKAKHRIPRETWQSVERLVMEDWSPEQISGWLSDEGGGPVSTERIYQHIYHDKDNGGDLHRHLRCQKIRRKRYGSNDRRGQIKNRVSIDERPEIVADRCRVGDWEADTVIGRPGGAVLVTLAERKTRLSIIALAPNKTANAVTQALLASLLSLTEAVHTITYDNGKEFAYHEAISKALKAKGYFAHPYHSWERGLNENTNGLIRQYLPKGESFDDMTQKEVEAIMEKLNNRPRKCLGFKTPNQVFFGINPPVAIAS